MTETEEQDALAVLVAPWLPNATVESLHVDHRCGCYSEYTTEPPEYHVTFKAPRPDAETDRNLSNVVRVIEGPIMQFALEHHTFTGCSCCCGEEGDTENVRPSLWVRIIPVRTAVDASTEPVTR